MTASDLAHLRAIDVVVATDEEIGEERAEHLGGLASLMACGIGSAVARAFVAAGIRNRAELASRSPDEMFVALLDRSSRTGEVVYDILAQSVYLAGTNAPEPSRLLLPTWTKMRKESGFDPLLLYWRYQHGENADLPRPTRRRLRIPTIGVSARIFEGGLDKSGELVTPTGQKDVVCLAGAPPRLILGHWMWRGGPGAFIRLEDLNKQDAVQVADEWFSVVQVKKLAAPVSLEAEARPGELLLATPPHRRVGIIGTPEMLKGVERGPMQVVVRAKPKR